MALSSIASLRDVYVAVEEDDNAKSVTVQYQVDENESITGIYVT